MATVCYRFCLFFLKKRKNRFSKVRFYASCSNSRSDCVHWKSSQIYAHVLACELIFKRTPDTVNDNFRYVLLQQHYFMQILSTLNWMYLYYALTPCWSFKHRLDIKLWWVDCSRSLSPYVHFITHSIVILTLIKTTWTLALQLFTFLAWMKWTFIVAMEMCWRMYCTFFRCHGTSWLAKLHHISNCDMYTFFYLKQLQSKWFLSIRVYFTTSIPNKRSFVVYFCSYISLFYTLETAFFSEICVFFRFLVAVVVERIWIR